MSEAITKQLAQSLKGYFRNEEFSDKVLHIIEIEDVAKLPTNSKETKTQEGEHSLECRERSLDENVSLDQAEHSKVSQVNTYKEEVPIIIVDDEAPKKLFYECSFFLSKSLSGDDVNKIENLVRDNGGSFTDFKEKPTFIISHYLLPKNSKTVDKSERTVQWVEDCITENEIKSSLVNLLYRPILIKTKPLAKLILTFGNCEESEKTQLIQIAMRLGASQQDLIFSRRNNNTATVSTHFVICNEDQSDSIQFNTALQWSIPCVSKQWLLKCSETLEKVDETNFIIKSINNTNKVVETSSTSENGNTYSTFPVHSMILSFNSQYFKALTSDSGMRETNYKNIVVKVNSGEGVYLELLIHSIYDQDVLKKLNVLELLKVLELADRFLCDLLIEYGLEVLQAFSIETFDQCKEILEQVKIFKSLASVSMNKAYKSMKDQCGKFLADYFHSLECYPFKQNEFTMLSIDSLLVLLGSSCSFLWHENNVVHFIISWLEAGEERQTEYNIENLLMNVRYQYMTLSYFIDVLSIDHSILSKWRGFSQWCLSITIYHGLSKQERKGRGIKCSKKIRSLSNTNTEVQSYVFKLKKQENLIDKLYMSWLVKNESIIYQGYVLRPIVRLQLQNDGTGHLLSLVLKFGDLSTRKDMENFYLKFNMAFGVFPSNVTYDPCAIIQNASANFFVQHFRQFNVRFSLTNTFVKHVGTIDKELFEKFQTNGMNIYILIGEAEPGLNVSYVNRLSEVSCYQINRKSTTTYGLHDDYPDIRLNTNRIPVGRYI